MKYFFYHLVWLLLLVSAPLCAAPEWHVGNSDKIIEVIRKYYPDVPIIQNNGNVVAKYSTQFFERNRTKKDGKLGGGITRTERPKLDGFIFRFSIEDGEYRGNPVLPYIMPGPFWETYYDWPQIKGKKAHYKIEFNYGSNVNQEFKRDFLSVLPKGPGKPGEFKISAPISWDSPHYGGSEDKFNLHITLLKNGAFSGTFDTIRIKWVENNETKVRREVVVTWPQSINGEFAVNGQTIRLIGQWPPELKIKNLPDSKYTLQLAPVE